MDESKVLLFIVEGPSDEASLAPALEQIVTDSKVKFKVMRADLTSDYDSTVDNIERRIKELGVKRFLTDNPQFSSNDICGIVHIVDLDGAFIDDDLVIQDDVEDVQYYDDKIVCKNREKFLRGKNNKEANLLHLSSILKISIPFGVIVPYSIFYMSCNLDHVLHNKRNSTKQQKQADSLVFADNYDDPEKFEAFFNGSDIKISGTYQETWEHIQIELNSLKRGSNFWICIEEHKKNEA